MYLHIVVTNDSLVKEGTDHIEDFTRTLKSASFLDYLRCQAIQIDQLIFWFRIKAKFYNHIAPQ